MIIDANGLPEGHRIEVDLCIVGSGLAGLALAREFLGSGLTVAVLEAGGPQISRRSQKLYQARSAGAPNHATTHSRFRAFGGSGTRWTGQLVPFEAIDLETREAIEHSGWPVTVEEMQPYYDRADALFGLAPARYKSEHWQTHRSFAAALGNHELQESIIRFAHPRDLGRMMTDSLEASESLSIYLNACLVQIRTTTAGETVTDLQLQSTEGHSLTVKAARYVLACGGIENPRLLLASQTGNGIGIGNAHDQVGRYFMDHPYLTTAVWELSSGARSTREDDSLHVIDDYERVARERGAHAVFTVNEAIRRDEGLNGCVGYFIHREAWQMRPAYYQPGGQALTHVADVLRGTRFADAELLRSARDLVTDVPGALATIRNAIQARGQTQPLLALRMCVEATPHRDSRVTLSSQRDSLGLPRAHVHWQMHERDWAGVSRFRQLLARRIDEEGLGRLIDDSHLTAAGWPRSMAGGKHHMGTTRMHEDPRFGVVDPHCRVHASKNLYVAGSSVFPTGGWANPSHMIIALAIRLADELKA